MDYYETCVSVHRDVDHKSETLSQAVNSCVSSDLEIRVNTSNVSVTSIEFFVFQFFRTLKQRTRRER